MGEVLVICIGIEGIWHGIERLSGNVFVELQG